jgi:hypothetical protein
VHGDEPGRSEQATDSLYVARLAGFEAPLVRWMFLFWIGTLGTPVALIKL